MKPVRAWVRPAGFTLVEMLVVLLVLGLLAGLAGKIVRPDASAALRVEAERLAQLLGLAHAEAKLSGRSIAWTAEAGGYRFWQSRDGSAWAEIHDDDLLRARTLPHSISIASLRVENAAPQSMRLHFLPDGLTPAFVLELASANARYGVAGSPMGDIRAVRLADESHVHAALE
jgi:general secretion pathway protein H